MKLSQNNNSLSSKCKNSRIFVGGLPHQVTRVHLLSYFSTFGDVTSLILPRNKKKGCLQGFAFVTFASQTGLRRALDSKEHRILGKKCSIRKALKCSQAAKETGKLQSLKLFVSGFRRSTSEKEVEELFEQFGEVYRVLYSVNSKTNQFRGFCYVVMKDINVYQQLIRKGVIKFKSTKIKVEAAKSLNEVRAERKKSATLKSNSTYFNSFNCLENPIKVSNKPKTSKRGLQEVNRQSLSKMVPDYSESRRTIPRTSLNLNETPGSQE